MLLIGMSSSKSDVVEYTSYCRTCKAERPLLSYEYQEHLTVFFIPVLRISRKRVTDVCAVCRSQHLAPPDEWGEQHIQRLVAELAEDRTDPSKVIKLHTAYVQHGQLDNARALSNVMKTSFSEEADVFVHLWRWYSLVGDHEQAEECQRRAAELRPDHPMLRAAETSALLASGDLQGAKERILASKDRSDPNELLAVAAKFQSQGDHESALEVFAKLLEVEPLLGDRLKFRQQVRHSEAKVGARQSMVRKEPIYHSALFVLSAAAALVLLSFFLLNAYLVRNRRLHVVNGLPVPISLSIDEQTLSVPESGATVLKLREGEHQVQLLEPQGLVEPFSFQIKNTLLTRWQRNISVLDPTRSAVVVLSETSYAKNIRNAKEQQIEISVAETYRRFPGAHYAFQDFPSRIATESDASKKTRRRVDLARKNGLRIAAASLDDLEPLMGLIERHLTVAPNTEGALSAYLHVISRTAAYPRAIHFLERGFEHETVSMRWHSAYQQLCDRHSPETDLIAKYDALCERLPGSADALVLRGRCSASVSQSQPFCQRALAADDSNVHAITAVARGLAATGELEASFAAIMKAPRVEPADQNLSLLQLESSIHLKRFDEAQQIAESQESDGLRALMQLRIAMAQGDGESAEATLKEFLDSAPSQAVEDYSVIVRCELLYLQQKFDALEEAVVAANAEKKYSPFSLFDVYLEKGELAKAEAEAEAKATSVSNPYKWLALSVALRSKGDEQAASKWFDRAIVYLSKGRLVNRQAANLLSSIDEEGADAKLRDLLLSPPRKALVLVAAAQIRTEGRAELLDMAEQVNFRRTVPQRAIQKAIETLKERT